MGLLNALDEHEYQYRGCQKRNGWHSIVRLDLRTYQGSTRMMGSWLNSTHIKYTHTNRLIFHAVQVTANARLLALAGH